MRALRVFFTACLFVAGFLGCTREEIVPYNNYAQSRLVVMGFISPGKTIDVYVGKSQPFGKTGYQPADFNEEKAQVTIANQQGQQQTLVLAQSNPSVYIGQQADFPIVAGQTYTLSVSSATGSVQATTTVPASPALWKHLGFAKAEGNYSLLTGTWAHQNLANVDYGVTIQYPGQTIFDGGNQGISWQNGLYHVKLEVYTRNVATINAVLLTRDSAFGQFSKQADLTVDIFENLRGTDITSVISAFKGVMPQAGNIKGGIGIFGSYLKDTRTLNR